MDDLGELQRRLQRLRPLTSAQISDLRGLFAAANVEMVYHSNAIEGNSLTLSETALVVEDGLTVGGKPLRDHLEAIDLFEALQFAEELASDRRQITETSLREVHALVLRRSNPDAAGRYRQIQNAITGTMYRPPSPLLVPERMTAVLADYQFGVDKHEHPAIVAADLHQGIVDVHPFEDGNGRTARLAMNIHLLKSGYPLTIIRVEDRQRYIESINEARMGPNRDAFRKFVADNVSRVLENYLSVLEPPTLKGPEKY
jgi:Fic family protein